MGSFVASGSTAGHLKTQKDGGLDVGRHTLPAAQLRRHEVHQQGGQGQEGMRYRSGRALQREEDDGKRDRRSQAGALRHEGELRELRQDETAPAYRTAARYVLRRQLEQTVGRS